ncbi:MAG: type II toxin-antitoxin system HicB family antitoxin [Chloroflexota bacterium]|nr:MAG: hypothetical protein DLM70_10555 [Chloroflexota bacterium]
MEIAGTGSFEREGLGYILVTYRVHPGEDGQYGTECVELGIRSCGDSVGEAFDAITEATSLYLSALECHDERARVFRERGIAVIPGDPSEEEGARNVPLRPSKYVHSDTIRLPAFVA